ncbi:hypothetical protein FPZ24_06065 [Sphingomonas panacisoli]|uniref:Sugar transporter n=1 Tax=Sphingomonas panacisoli TaxID=1813879 RepID=A0A5B8LG72_9SPHN|nr:hypothetical protein [Sphingomonas panacisoli]QDZ07101.1 hypothetical protein FPZ24_06065 [Sphingomonas panacisoli]
MRPKSIVYYEIAYLASVLLGIAVTAMTWTANSQTQEVEQIRATLGPSFLPILYVFIYTLSLALWYFTARVPNAVAKWIVVGWFVLSAIGVGLALIGGNMPVNLSGALALAAFVLNAIAVYLLFRPDARAWFGEKA